MMPAHIARITKKWSGFHIEKYLKSSEQTFNIKTRHQMMQVSAIVNEIDKSFETNDSFFARSRTFAILFLFSLLKVDF
jgi:hypothetical protein